MIKKILQFVFFFALGFVFYSHVMAAGEFTGDGNTDSLWHLNENGGPYADSVGTSTLASSGVVVATDSLAVWNNAQHGPLGAVGSSTYFHAVAFDHPWTLVFSERIDVQGSNPNVMNLNEVSGFNKNIQIYMDTYASPVNPVNLNGVESTSTIELHRWYNFILTFDGGTGIGLYFKPLASSTYSHITSSLQGSPPTEQFVLGGYGFNTPSSEVNGAVDEMFVQKTVWTVSDAQNYWATYFDGSGGGGGGSLPDTIRMSAPVQGQVLLNDPVQWIVNATSSFARSVLVQYATSTMASNNPTSIEPDFTLKDYALMPPTCSSGSGVFCNDSGFTNVNETKSLLTRMAPASSTQTWYVRAFLFPQNPDGVQEGDIPVASSTEISFTMHQTVFSQAVQDQATNNTTGGNPNILNPNYTNQVPFVGTSTLNVSTSTNGFCVPTNDWLSAALQWTLCLQPFATNAIAGTAQGVKLIPILNTFTSLNALVQNEVSPQGELLIQASGTKNMMQQYDELDLYINIPSGLGETSTTKFVVISSSSYLSVTDKKFHDDAFVFEDFYFALAPIGLAVILFL